MARQSTRIHDSLPDVPGRGVRKRRLLYRMKGFFQNSPRKRIHHSNPRVLTSQGHTTLSFRRTPLSNRGNCIRLVCLHSAFRDDEEIECTINEYSVKARPPYDAVSYSWGPPQEPENCRQVLLNGSQFLVRDNLWSLLHRLRRLRKDRMVWIDAMCIDQDPESVLERNHQVSLMAHIYQHAECVSVWLGEEGDDSEKGMQVLKELVTIWSYCRARSDTSIYLSQVLTRNHDRHASIEAFINLLQREYWTRRWIIQEILHARTVAFYCGRSKVVWTPHVLVFPESEFLALFNELERQESFIRGRCENYIEGLVAFKLLKQRQCNPHHKPVEDLRLLLQRYHTTECTNPLDTVYALLSLTSEYTLNGRSLAVDYAMNTVQLYVNVMLHCKPKNWLKFALMLQNSLRITIVDVTAYVETIRRESSYHRSHFLWGLRQRSSPCVGEQSSTRMDPLMFLSSLKPRIPNTLSFRNSSNHSTHTQPQMTIWYPASCPTQLYHHVTDIDPQPIKLRTWHVTSSETRHN